MSGDAEQCVALFCAPVEMAHWLEPEAFLDEVHRESVLYLIQNRANPGLRLSGISWYKLWWYSAGKATRDG
jgi:hypothetical protein